MKKIWSKLFALLVVATGLSLAACSDTPDSLDELDLNRCLSPLNFSATVANGKDVTFKWDVMQGADQFVVEVYNDAAMSDLAYTFTVPAGDVPYTTTLESDKTFYARVKAQISTGTKADSKWSIYDKKIATYEVKDALYPSILSRTTTSVTVAWDATIADADEVSHITCIAVPSAAADVEKTVELTAEDIQAGHCTIGELNASTQYLFTLYFKSADRGEVNGWTMPDLTGATAVSTAAGFKQALTDGAAKIKLAYNDGAVYDMGTAALALTHPVAIYGEQSPEGKLPAVAAIFAAQSGMASFYAEGVAFQSPVGEFGGSDPHSFFNVTAALEIESIAMLNCEISGYTHSLVYISAAAQVARQSYSSLLIHDMGDSQDTFDMRAGAHGSFTLENSSLYNGCRTILRADATTSFSGDIKVNNNFFYQVCTSTNGNNNGILFVRGGVSGGFEAQNNLFVSMTGGATKTGFVSTDGNAVIPATIANNHFYNCTIATWFTKVSQSAATANGGSVLAADPCVKSAALNFTLQNDVLIGKQVGDPRWWSTAGPVIPEEMTTLSEGHIWDFTNAAYYAAGNVTETAVMGNLMFGVGSKTFTISSGGVVRYNAASTLDGDGVPTDGYLAFRVSTPGSVVLKPILSDNGSVNDCINVIVGGKACGSAYAGALSSEFKQKVVLKDLPAGDETMVYLVSTGAIDLEYLEWTTDTSFSPVAVTLGTPTLTLSSKSVVNGTEQALTISWTAIEHVHTYKLLFGAAEKSFASSVTSYTMTASEVAALAADDYAISLTALADPNDARYQDSAAATATFSVEFLGDGSAVEMAYPTAKPFVLTGNVSDKGDSWQLEKNASGNLETPDIKTGGIYTPAVKDGYVVEKIELVATTAKKVLLWSKFDSKTGFSEKLLDAEVATTANETTTLTPNAEYARIYVAASTNGGTKIKSMKVYYKVATPVDPGTPKSYSWDFADNTVFTAGDLTATTVFGDLTILASATNKVTFEAAKRLKMNGGSAMAADAVTPETRALQFTINSNGKLTLSCASGSSGDLTREAWITVGTKATLIGTAPASQGDLTFDVTGITAPTTVYVYVKAAINIYSAQWDAAN